MLETSDYGVVPLGGTRRAVPRPLRCLRCHTPMRRSTQPFYLSRCDTCEDEYNASTARRVFKVAVVSLAVCFGAAIGVLLGGMVALLPWLLVPSKALAIPLAAALFLVFLIGSIRVSYEISVRVVDTVSRAAFLHQRMPELPTARVRRRP